MRFNRKPIAIMAWTPELVTLFHELKFVVTSSPVLTRFNPDKLKFLETYWRAEGMGWILMQSADDDKSQCVMRTLQETSECLIGLSKNGARLKVIAFGSISCTDFELKYHSFAGDTVCRRWAIGQNRHLLWGQYFRWICNCAAVKEVLEYKVSTSMICLWVQECFGYNFSIVRKINKMMAEVYALKRRFGTHIAQHFMIASILHHTDKIKIPQSYDGAIFNEEEKAGVITNVQ